MKWISLHRHRGGEPERFLRTTKNIPLTSACHHLLPWACSLLGAQDTLETPLRSGIQSKEAKEVEEAVFPPEEGRRLGRGQLSPVIRGSCVGGEGRRGGAAGLRDHSEDFRLS